jgi:hypothetical protein
MQSDDFWLREAHLNGIYDDAMIRFVVQGNRDMIRGMIDPDKALEYHRHRAGSTVLVWTTTEADGKPE